ncbi:metallophosphoesterase [Thermococcus celer]|uniref:Phosphoesterase n=1 Tax=Thermococcus celer Vu 13 = JCM 8558 TaxID=1293037 RepID=A0A218P2E1_THECE|nr:metallophosphoesterase [Thermococcus celer]ASI99084.1 3',5'-cyclic-nucleotide phosphodiesterase [Thermococcus celer Vu 13 = JCM 8558]
MLIAVTGDTHHGDKTKNLPSLLFEGLEKEKPDLILHTGDVTSHELLERLEEFAPVIAVRGNADHLNLPEERVIDAEEAKIGLLHGHQFLSLNAQFLTLKALDMGVDVLVFGHTHRFYYDTYSVHGNRVVLLNPGSPTFPRMDSPGFALLEVNGGSVRVERIRFW